MTVLAFLCGTAGVLYIGSQNGPVPIRPAAAKAEQLLADTWQHHGKRISSGISGFISEQIAKHAPGARAAAFEALTVFDAALGTRPGGFAGTSTFHQGVTVAPGSPGWIDSGGGGGGGCLGPNCGNNGGGSPDCHKTNSCGGGDNDCHKTNSCGGEGNDCHKTNSCGGCRENCGPHQVSESKDLALAAVLAWMLVWQLRQRQGFGRRRVVASEKTIKHPKQP